MKCKLLPGLLGDLSPTWILWSWPISRGIRLDFPLLPPAYLHTALREPAASETSAPVRNGLVITSVCIIWIKIYIQLPETGKLPYAYVCPCIQYCWESNSIPVPALSTEPLSAAHGPCSHSSWIQDTNPTVPRANIFYNVGICQCKCMCRLQIAFPTVNFCVNPLFLAPANELLHIM